MEDFQAHKSAKIAEFVNKYTPEELATALIEARMKNFMSYLTGDEFVKEQELFTAKERLENVKLFLGELRTWLDQNEPCGYYCDENIGHIDHKFTRWCGSLQHQLSQPLYADETEQEAS